MLYESRPTEIQCLTQAGVVFQQVWAEFRLRSGSQTDQRSFLCRVSSLGRAVGKWPDRVTDDLVRVMGDPLHRGQPQVTLPVAALRCCNTTDTKYGCLVHFLVVFDTHTLQSDSAHVPTRMMHVV